MITIKIQLILNANKFIAVCLKIGKLFVETREKML